MNEIKCPQCGTVFQVDETGYAKIVSQIRDSEFARELEQRERSLVEQREQAVRLAVAQERSRAQESAASSAARIAELEALLESAKREGVAGIEALKRDQEARERAARAEHARVLADAAAERDARIAKLEARLKASEHERENEARLAQAERGRALAEAAASKDARIAELEQQAAAQTSAFEAEKQLAVAEARAALERERDALAAQVDLVRAEGERAAGALREEMATKLRAKDELISYKDEEIARYKDMKARLSTKMVGESLEQHCEAEFNKLRATAFPRAYFEKDNDVVDGTKGDYVFRECDEDGTEVVSIMFEMKNENDETATKHRNEDFLKKLDADRRKKGCEYAVLVTLLEPESELYNEGIVDVGYRYEKMYVVRADGGLQGEVRSQLRAGQPQVPAGHRRDRQDHRPFAEDQRRAFGQRAQPAPGQRQGPGPHHQAADAEQPHHEGRLRGSAGGRRPGVIGFDTMMAWGFHGGAGFARDEVEGVTSESRADRSAQSASYAASCRGLP